MSGKVDSTKPVTTRKISFQTLESNGTAEKESRVANRMRQSLSKDFATLHLEDKSGEFNHDGGLLSQLSISNSALQEEPKIEMQERKGLAKISFIEQQLDDQRRGSVESSEPAESEDGSESNNVIVCRICEEKVAQDCLSEHSQYCVALRQCINKIQEYDDMLLQNLALLEKTLVNLTNTQPANNETTLKRIQFLELTKKMIQTTINQLVTVNDIEDVRVAWEDYQNNSQNLESHLIDEDQKLKGAITHLLGSKTKTIRRKSVSSTKRKEVSYVVRPDKSGKGKLSRAFIKSTINVGVTPSIRDFAMVKKLSRGAYGRVYLAMKKTTKDYFAIKVINKKHMVNKTQVERILAERDILAQVDSPFIVKLYYSFQTVENLYMVMEYLNGGDMLSLLDTVGKFPEAWAQFYMAELTAALAHLHSLGIVHRDIKPHNLLIDKRGHMKLADFGLSRRNDKQNSSIADADEVNKLLNNAGPLDEQDLELDENVNRMRDFDNDFETVDKTMKRANSFVGTPEYLAPEVIMGSGYDESVDWWGVGVVTFQLMTGKQPFYDDTSDQVTFENILYRRITWPKYLSFEAKDFIDSLLTVDVSDRLGAHGSKEIASHPFFKNINWKDLDVIEPSFVPMVENPEDTRYFKDMEWSDNSLNSQSKEKPSGEGDTANEVNFVDFAYTNVNMLKAANEEAKDKSTAMNFIKWMDDDAEPRTKCGTKSDGLKKTSSTLTSKNDITNDVKELRCLVAEDNPIVLKVAQALLKTLGFITETVDNGLKALNAAEDHHFDLIFMDIMMPEMDGLEATKRIRAGNGPNKNTVVVAFTAMADTVGETREQFLAHGMNDTLPKPFTKGDLYAIITKWLKMKV